jgi:3-methyladenine DNA glycosylase AlkD
VTHQQIIKYLHNLADPQTAAHSQRFFKTGVGEYGHGDKFLGIRVPVLRKAVKLFQKTSLTQIKTLLKSEYHEIRLFALLLLVHQFACSDEIKREKIYNLYLNNTKYINNWDLVDSSAPNILGTYLIDKDRSVLYTLVRSKRLWDRRIAIMSSFYFIKNEQYTDALKLSKILLNDKEDLIHKASGWMLREIGNRDNDVEELFLRLYYKQMPRTMLRYSIEKFSKERRQMYLKGVIG